MGEWSKYHRMEVKDEERKKSVLESLAQLGFSMEVYKDLEFSADFIAIVGLALKDPTRKLSFFRAEIQHYAEKIKSNSTPRSPVAIEFPQNSFADEAAITHMMWDEAE